MELVFVSIACTVLMLVAELSDAVFMPSLIRCLPDREVPSAQEEHTRKGAAASLEFASRYDQAA